jgi:hydrogenase expression/formation protein HypC
MCLGVPGKVIEVGDGVAIVDFWGVKRTVRLDIVDREVAPGDYILNHVGFAIRRIPEEEVGVTLLLYEELLAASDRDLMAADVKSEIDATEER